MFFFINVMIQQGLEKWKICLHYMMLLFQKSDRLELMNPLVSVIIPVYNVKPYLREALDSVIGQTYRNTEIIIIDDGSTDGSENICDEYTSDPRVTVIHQINGGLSNARNVGLDLAKGNYLCFLDSDDAYHSTFVEKMLGKAQSSDAEMVVCRFIEQKTTEKLGTKKRGLMPIQSSLSQGTYNREEALRGLAEGKLNVSVWNKLYKDNLWRNVRFPNGHNHEDIATMYKIVYACQTVSMIDDVLFFYRDRDESITHYYSKKNVRDCMLARSHFEEFILTHHPEIFSDDLVELYKQKNLNGHMDLFANCFDNRELRDEIRKTIIEKGKEINRWNISTRVAYLMVCHMPWLFRCTYKIYLPCRLLVWRVTGR